MRRNGLSLGARAIILYYSSDAPNEAKPLQPSERAFRARSESPPVASWRSDLSRNERKQQASRPSKQPLLFASFTSHSDSFDSRSGLLDVSACSSASISRRHSKPARALATVPLSPPSEHRTSSTSGLWVSRLVRAPPVRSQPWFSSPHLRSSATPPSSRSRGCLSWLVCGSSVSLSFARSSFVAPHHLPRPPATACAECVVSRSSDRVCAKTLFPEER